MDNLFIHEKVDIIEAYSTMREQIPVGSVIPVMFDETSKPSIGLILGHVFKNIRKSPRKYMFGDVCLPVVFVEREKFICSLLEDCGKIIAIADRTDVFDFQKWKNNDFIVEVDAILPKTEVPYSLYE